MKGGKNLRINTKTKRRRDVPLMFYITQAEKDELINAAREQDQSISEYCRKILFKKEVKEED